MQVAKFLAQIMPQLLELGRDLYQQHKGDVIQARRDIQDRRDQIARDRAEADERIAALNKARQGG